MNLTIMSVDYHRNGIAGAPFHAVIFDDPEQDLMLGIVFQQEHHVAVFNLTKLANHDIAFGSNSWRGDRYEPHLREAITKHNLQAAAPADVTTLTPFDDYEISGVREFGCGTDRFCERVPDEEATFWSLYGHIPGKGAQCIGDFKSRSCAEEVYFLITKTDYNAPRLNEGAQP
ncbi:hypothetical protein [Planctomyces sp. SH-PL14]|uniref:hypothetical protein n=1 Tax=Planctomyces sp. SH-PL14 TaxID=1632864 RepID=UPI00078E8754|nr:hypothetical protein [Planctomyces sp. SH-PL14]AMV22603.1 hypothetical protein VT03_32205 [Planctomyces sp. SH-PL14]